MCYISIIKKRITQRSGIWQQSYVTVFMGKNPMAKEWAKNFYSSRRWEKCKDAYKSKRIAVDGGLCEECHEKPGYIVHHRTTLTKTNISDPNISLNHENLEYVCKDCHDLFEGHGLNKGIKPLCRFDEDGQPISLREIDRDRDSCSPP